MPINGKRGSTQFKTPSIKLHSQRCVRNFERMPNVVTNNLSPHLPSNLLIHRNQALVPPSKLTNLKTAFRMMEVVVAPVVAEVDIVGIMEIEIIVAVHRMTINKIADKDVRKAKTKVKTVEKEIAEMTTTGTMEMTTTGTMETATTETETGFQSVAIAEEPIIMKMIAGSRTEEKEMTTIIGVTTIVTTIVTTNQIMSSTLQFNR